MHYLASAWSAVTAVTVKNCFTKCFGVRGGDAAEAGEVCDFTDCDELNSAMETVGTNRITYNDYTSVDDAVVTAAVCPSTTSWQSVPVRAPVTTKWRRSSHQSWSQPRHRP
ncbi:hypothetical protein HPB48_001982 [Haemaphysalis longicornis]|uniref:Uncharacterized protein n=1 Tax=Haemaphysalis longicornis TaxID=44386 RepID=A0A9J6FXR4_HAELO|nr:hypothetical protein HPB48_001982 [Haemaphysalis longicornis]